MSSSTETKRSKSIHCEDGGYLLVRNITRLFLAVDTISREATIKASVIGPAMPFTVAKHSTSAIARNHLEDLIDMIEGE
jgi:hypothetical protein